MYKFFIKPILFLVDPEKIHSRVHHFLHFCSRIPGINLLWKSFFRIKNQKLKTTVFGLEFDNPVGLAAGFDKNASLFSQLGNLGFGFIEIGTVTPKPQSGNPKKRLFRLPLDKALINRMGLNNLGSNQVAENLKKRNKKSSIIIGGNIGKNNNTLPENSIDDYLISFKTLYPYVDYISVNISCPNVGSLNLMNDIGFLKSLFEKLEKENKESKPVLIKISPDVTNQQLDDLIELVKKAPINGIIATNTTTNRTGLKTDSEQLKKIGNGGLSGYPLKNRSTEVIRYISEKSNKSIPIIGLGGIHSVEDALEKLDAGASLIQIYTGFIYEGPSLIKKINKGILKRRS